MLQEAFAQFTKKTLILKILASNPSNFTMDNLNIVTLFNHLSNLFGRLFQAI